MKIFRKNKKRITAMLCSLLVVSMIAGAFSACSTGSNESAGNSDKKKTQFTVGFDAEFPPYGYKDEETGEYVGFDLDLAKEVCDRNGWELVKQPIEWNSKDMELKSGAVDCLWNGFTINGRESNYTWSKAYVDNSQVIVVKKDSGITKLSDLAGKVVIVQMDSSALAAFTGEDATKENKELAASFKELLQVGDYNSAFLNLESGAASAICMDIGVASYQLQERNGEFLILDEKVSTEQYGIGFLKGNTELRDKVQNTLDEMCQDGTFEKIADEWKLTDSVCLGKEGTDAAYLVDAGKENYGDAAKNKDDSKDNKKKDNIWSDFKSITKQLSEGMLASLAIFFFTLLFSLPLGIPLMFMRMSKIAPIRWIAKFYISVMRGTPLMLQLLVVFYGPYYLFDISVPYGFRFYAVIIGFALNYAAYFAEIYRGGIESIPIGQYEAAQVLGYSNTQRFCKIIFPQMVKRVLPAVTNEVITLVKDTSLAFALAYAEMFTLAKQVAAAKASIVPLFIAGLFYYIFNFVVAYVMEKIEKKLQYYK